MRTDTLESYYRLDYRFVGEDAWMHGPRYDDQDKCERTAREVRKLEQSRKHRQYEYRVVSVSVTTVIEEIEMLDECRDDKPTSLGDTLHTSTDATGKGCSDTRKDEK